MNRLIFRMGSGACAIVVGIALSNAALAQPRPAETAKDYPNRPIRLVVPSSPGGGTDIIARQLSAKLTERWGQQVIVDNRPGAGQMIRISLVAKSPPDGYTLVMTATPLAGNPRLHQ